MMRPPQDPMRRSWWLLPAFAAVMLAPAAIGYAALAVALLAMLARATARRAAERRAERSPSRGSADAIPLGRDPAGRAVSLTGRQLSAHALILGASGAGKSTSMLAILTEHILRGRPVIAIDMKGSPEFARQLRAAAAASGRPLRVWSPDGPARWNPLQYGNATELKDKLIATERFTEPHYQRAAERYVQLALQVLQELHPERPTTIGEVVDVMDPRRLAGRLSALPPGRAERVQDYLAGLTPDQLSAVRGLGTRLAIITESHTGAFLTPCPGQTLDLRAALEGREVVLFSLNSSAYGKLAAQLGTLAIQDLVTAVGDRLNRVEAQAPGDRAPEQALVGIDEFSALESDNVLALLARGRASGVSALLATQELADLNRAGRGLADQVLGNTAIKIIHRQDAPGSAQTIAQMAGTETVWDRTYQIAGGPFGPYSIGQGTRRQAERFIVHPNEIKTLRTGEAIVVAKLPQTSVQRVRVTPPRAMPGPPDRGPAQPATAPAPASPARPATRGAGGRPAVRPPPVDRGGPELG